MSKLITVVAIAAMALANAAQAADKFVLQLHGPAQFQFAGYYAAQWQGYYRDAGLSVEIKPAPDPGGTRIDPAREVLEGRAQFGTGGADLVVRIAQGQPLLLLAPIFQQSGAAVYYRDDSDYASPGALAKARVGRLPASDILDIELATALRAEGVDPGALKPVPLQPGETVAALADKTVDAAPGSAWEVPWRAHEKGFLVKAFNPADYRVEFYGDTLFTTRRLAKAEPATVRAFRAASLKGWEYALTHADEVASRMRAELPPPPGIADVEGFNGYQKELAGLLARHPAVTLGHSNPDRWRRIEASMAGVGALLRAAEPDDFVYDPDAEQRNRTDFRALTILGATLGIALALIGLLWLSRRRRAPARAPVVNEPAGEVRSAFEAAPTSPLKPAPPAVVQPVTGPAEAAPTDRAASPISSPPVSVAELPAADLNAIVARLERVMRRTATRGVAFRLSLLPELWSSRADPVLVRKLVLELVEAAAADLKGVGELVVGTRNYAFDEAAVAATPGAQTGEFARITVRDSGPGLSDDALEGVLDPAVTTRQSAAAAARGLEALGGFVRVESAEGVGTAVHLYFPRASDKPAESTNPPDDKPAKAAE